MDRVIKNSSLFLKFRLKPVNAMHCHYPRMNPSSHFWQSRCPESHKTDMISSVMWKIMCKSCSHHKHAYDVSTQMHNGIRLLAIPEDFWAINIRHRYLYCGESTDPILATYLLIHLIIHVYCSNFDNSLTTKHSDISNCTGCSITPKVLMIVSTVYYKMWSGVNCLLYPANLFAHSPPFPLDVLLKFLIKGGL